MRALELRALGFALALLTIAVVAALFYEAGGHL